MVLKRVGLRACGEENLPEGTATADTTLTPGASPTGTATFADGTTVSGTLPTSTLTPIATLVTPDCATAPTPIPDWEEAYGEQIAQAALAMFANSANYYVWGANTHPDDEYDSDPPPRKTPGEDDTFRGINLKGRTNGAMPIVCVDVPVMAYGSVGINLGEGRHVGSLASEIGHTNLINWDNDKTSLKKGDIIMTYEYDNYVHSGVVVDIPDSDYRTYPSHIYVVQASYSVGSIERSPLSKFMGDGVVVYYGHTY